MRRFTRFGLRLDSGVLGLPYVFEVKLNIDGRRFYFEINRAMLLRSCPFGCRSYISETLEKVAGKHAARSIQVREPG